MRIIQLKEDCFKSWDKFCLDSDDAWFWHTTKWSKYCAAYKESAFKTIDRSFYVTDDSGILAVCPLFLEERQGPDGTPCTEIAAAGSSGLMIVPALCNGLTDDRRERILKAAFDYIDSIAREYGITRATFRMTPLTGRTNDFNWLLKYGCLDGSVNTQVIDLSIAPEQLWGALRKGHKYDVHRGEKFYDVHMYDATSADKKAFDEYRLLHHKAAGRMTRPLETFEMMYHWILSGNGMLCGVSKNGRYAGFSYIILYKDGAYYGSASDDPEFETNIPISHVIQWKVIQWLKERDYKKYEIGQQQFGAQIHDIPTSKELSISFFKRGFGGKTVPSYRGIKYYDKDLMEAELKNNLNKLLSHYEA
jgi:hypothetical protein